MEISYLKIHLLGNRYPEWMPSLPSYLGFEPMRFGIFFVSRAHSLTFFSFLDFIFVIIVVYRHLLCLGHYAVLFPHQHRNFQNRTSCNTKSLREKK